MFRVLLGSTAISIAASLFSFPAQAVEVYMFRGAGDLSFVAKNLHFSRGLDKMVDQLNAEGIHAEVRRFQQVDDALSTIRQRRPESVAFVGHSMGALASMAIAKSLKKDGINIVYMGLIDIPGPVGVAGDNVARVDNYYSINPVYGKLTNTGSHPNARNINVTGYMHNRMDDAPEIQNGILSAIREIHALEQLQYQQPESPQFVEVPVTVDPVTTASVPQQLPQVHKLTNLLHLAEGKRSAAPDEFVDHAVQTLSSDVKNVEFEQMENFGKAKRASRLASIPLLGILIFIVAAPGSFFDASKRLLSPGTEFQRPAPFQINVVPGDIELIRGDSLDLQITLSGTDLPSTIELQTRNEGKKKSRMKP